MTQNKYYIGLTGGIASGKSTASRYIKLKGYEVIDFDEIGHSIYNDEETIIEVRNAFGSKVFTNNKIDRKKLSKVVFSDKKKLEILNKITHARIYDIATEKSKSIDEKIVFFDIPLLFETKNEFKKFYSSIDEIWVISTTLNNQITRLMIRDSISIDEAKKRIKAQMNLKLKERMGDVVFYNNTDEYDLYNDLDIELKNLEKRVLYE